jgi:uncharacterized membrane protein YqjE
MLPFTPARRILSGGNRLGAGISDFASGLTSGVAKNIVTEAEPAVRRVVRDERNRLAEALIGGIPFAGLAALAFVGTRYLVPDDSKKGKAIGYGAAAASAAAGGWWTIAHLTEETLSTPPPGAAQSSGLDPVIKQAAQAIVAEAEPKVRSIVQEEKARAVDAAMIAVPFAAVAMAAFLGTMFMIDDQNRKMKAVGYAGTAALLGLGAWFALDKERDAMTKAA